MHNESLIKTHLRGTPVTHFVYYDSTSSTNTVGLDMIKSKPSVRDWTLIYADEQTAGRGRFDRKWVMLPGASLAFSLLFLPTQLEMEKLPLFSPMAALAVCSALEKMTGLHPQIKWPNDVLLNRKKMSGILAETSWSGDRMGGMVLGIGINVSSGSIPPEGVALFPATCVETELGMKIDRFEILRETLIGLDTWRKNLGKESFYIAWRERLAFRGEVVNLEQSNGKVISGVLNGISAAGDLLLELSDWNYNGVFGWRR